MYYPKDTKHNYRGFEIIGTAYESEGGYVLGGRHYVEGGFKRNYNIKFNGKFVYNPNNIIELLRYAKETIDEYLLKQKL